MKGNCNLRLLLFIATLSLFACNPQREASDLLRQAQNVVATQPDKALQLIDSIFYPEQSLSTREYMSYLVTRVQARYRNLLSIDEDTLIFIARDYFAKHNNDLRQTALAFFYSGCVYHEQGSFENAMQHYKRAVEYAAQTNDVDLQGLIQYNIGDLFAATGLHLEALEMYKKAEQFFANSLSGNAAQRQIRSLAAIGQRYMLSGLQDNAFVAFYKGLELAKLAENEELERLLMQNLGVAYHQMQEYEEAERRLRRSFELNSDAANLPRFYLNFAGLFSRTNQTDSMNLYINKLKQTIEQSQDLYFKVSAFDLLVANAINNDDFVSALNYQQRRSEAVTEIHERRLSQSVYEARQRFNYQRYQYKYTQALLIWQRWVIFFLIFCFIASLFAVFIYRRMIHQRNRMLSMQNVINTLKLTNEDIQQANINTHIQNEQLSKVLLWKFDTLYKFLLVKTQLGKDVKISANAVVTRFCNAILGKNNPNQWDILAEIIEEVHPGFQLFLKNNYPQFSEMEHKVAVLSFAGVQPKEISFILEKNSSSIHVSRTSIRKNMNLTVAGIDFCTILKEEYRVSRTH
jgi:tetratricopeptide (TPR) repeat protein